MVRVIALMRRLALTRRGGLAIREWGGETQRVLAERGDEASVRRCGNRRRRPKQTEA